MSFDLRQRGQTVRPQDPNQYGQYLSGTRTEVVTRAGDSTTLYADSVAQRDTTNGYIFRAGYGASGFETWMLDVQKNKVTIKGGVIYCLGPFRFDAEGYADSSVLDSQGQFECDSSAVPALNAMAAAIRAATITSAAGSSAGYGHSRRGVINSPVCYTPTPVNWTKLSDCVIESGCGKTKFYSGEFSAAGAYLNGVANGAGVTIAATAAPIIDTTGCQGTRFVDIVPAAQRVSGTSLGPATTEITSKPGCGWLIAATETRAAGTFTTNANSNNLVFERCSAIGYYKIAPVFSNGSVINKWMDGGFQQYTNETQARVAYFGKTTVSTAGVPGDAGTGIDSPFYPNPSSPANGDERMCGTEAQAGAGAWEFWNTEFHDMTVYNRIEQGGSTSGQGNLSSSILLYKTTQMTFNGGPSSTSGGAVIEMQGTCRNTTLRGMEFYNDASNDGASGANTYGNAIVHANGATMTAMVIENCVLNMPVVQAAIKGSANAVFDGLRVTGCTHVTGTLLVRMNYTFTDPTSTEQLINSYLECGGRGITLGGRTAGSVELVTPGSITEGSQGKWHGATSAGLMRVTDGTVGTPAIAFNSETGLGWYRSASHQMALSSNNATPLTISDTQVFGPSGTVTNPGISFGTDGTKGMYHGGSNLLSFAVASTKRLEVTSTGADVTGALTATTSITAGTFLAVGASLPASGAGRFGNATGLHWRGTGGADINGIGLDGSDLLQIGQSASLSGIVFNAANTLSFQKAGTTKIAVNDQVEMGTAALATNATVGHFCIPSCAGAATGAVSPTAGMIPVIYDSTNHKIYALAGGTWRSTAALT